LKEGENRVGAKSVGEGVDPEVDLSAVEPAGQKVVSRRHAILRVEAGRVTLVDLGSTNGTTVDGQRLPPNVPKAVDGGSRISFANIPCRVVV
jgi:pSer/pThr/pTyr-binding forkhead associated (FHA) protein